MAKGISNTQRTLRALRQEGCLCGIVERFNPYGGFLLPNGNRTGIRQDLFEFIDIIAIYPNNICAIQSCGQSFAEHDRKILANEIAPEWLKVGGKIQLWGWRKVLKQRGGKLKTWKPRVKDYTLDDFGEPKQKTINWGNSPSIRT